MNGIVSTEELIYLDSDEDEDPLRLSPPSSLRPSTSKALQSEVQQRFSNLRRTDLTSDPRRKLDILANALRRRVAPTRVGDLGSQKAEIIDFINLDSPSPPTTSPTHTHNHRPSPSPSSKKIPLKRDINSTMNKMVGRQAPSTPSKAPRYAPNHQTPTSSYSSNKRPLKEDINSTMNKLVGSQATNHDIFLKFLEICSACDSDCTEIMDKKTKPYYAKIEPAYAASEDFRSLLEEKISILAKSPALVFNILINVHDEIKRNKLVKQDRKKPKLENDVSLNKPSTSSSNKPSSSSSSNKGTNSSYVDEAFTSSKENNRKSDDGKAEENSNEVRKKKKMEAHVKKLEKALCKCHSKIKRLEEKEVDWDDEDNSIYLELQLFRKKCIDIHRKLTQLKGVRDESKKAPTRVSCVSPYPQVSANIEKYVSSNRKFPDFCDILKIYKSAKTGLRPVELHTQAEETFKEIGNQIQRQRQVYDWNLACYFLGTSSDPAEVDTHLMIKLSNNKKLGDSKLDEVLASFTRRQYEMKLEPAEVTDEQVTKTDSSDDEEEAEEDEGSDRQDMRDASCDLRDRLSDDDDQDDNPEDDDDDDPEDDDNDDGEGQREPVHDRSAVRSAEKAKVRKKKKRQESEDSLSESESPRVKKSRRDKSPSGSKDSPRGKKITLDTPVPVDQLWSFTDNALMLANMKKLPASASHHPSTGNNHSSPKQTKVQPSQPQQNVGKVNIVSPLRKFQEETLMNYLEITYKIDPSVINGKLVSSSSPSTVDSGRKCVNSTVGVVDSTDWNTASQSRSRLEKTGSDPEVTSTSFEGEPCLVAKVDVSAQTVSEFPSSVSGEKGTTAGDGVTAETGEQTAGKASSNDHLRVGSGDGKQNKAAVADSDSKLKKQASSTGVYQVLVSPRSISKQNCVKSGADLSTKTLRDSPETAEVSVSELSSRVCASPVKDVGTDLGAETGEINLINPVYDETDTDETFLAELVEETVVADKEGGVSVNEVLDNSEDWDSTITPTMVAKEVLVVPTNGDCDGNETEIETTTNTEVNLNSSDEFVQSPPTIKIFERKGRNMVPCVQKEELKEPGQSSTSELEVNSSKKLIDQPLQTVILNQKRSEILLAEPAEKENLIASLPTTSELEQGRSDEVSGAGLENVTLQKKQIEEAAITKAIALGTPGSDKRDGNLTKNSNSATDDRNGSTTSHSNCSQNSSSSRENDKLPKSKPFIGKGPLKRAEVLKTLSPLKDPLRISNPTARKSFPGKDPVLKNSTTQLLRNMQTCGTVSEKNTLMRDYSRNQEVVTIRTTKPNARKSFPGVSCSREGSPLPSFQRKLKEEQLQGEFKQGPNNAKCQTIIHTDVITIDSE